MVGTGICLCCNCVNVLRASTLLLCSISPTLVLVVLSEDIVVKCCVAVIYNGGLCPVKASFRLK